MPSPLTAFSSDGDLPHISEEKAPTYSEQRLSRLRTEFAGIVEALNPAIHEWNQRASMRKRRRREVEQQGAELDGHFMHWKPDSTPPRNTVTSHSASTIRPSDSRSTTEVFHQVNKASNQQIEPQLGHFGDTQTSATTLLRLPSNAPATQNLARQDLGPLDPRLFAHTISSDTRVPHSGQQRTASTQFDAQGKVPVFVHGEQ